MAIIINGTTGITDADGGEVLSTADYTTISRTVDPDNRIINGDFSFWQRGVSFTTNTYGADRWTNTFIGGTVTQSRQAFPLGDTLGVNTPAYFLRQTVSGQSLASNAAIMSQHIESVRSYAGQTITVLGWARRSSGTGNMAINAGQYFGLGGSPSTSVLTAGQTVTLTGSWVPFAVVIDVPSITGKTLGTDGRDYLDINFWTSAGSNFAVSSNSLGPQTIGVDLWGIHIKLGTHTASTTSQYRPRDPGTELALCQRYCSTAVVGAQSTAANIVMTVPWFTKVTMRAAPAITVTLPAFAAVNATVTQDVVSSPDGGHFSINATVAGGYVVGRLYRLDAEF
jgi:hypothetical protein